MGGSVGHEAGTVAAQPVDEVDGALAGVALQIVRLVPGVLEPMATLTDVNRREPTRKGRHLEVDAVVEALVAARIAATGRRQVDVVDVVDVVVVVVVVE